jgi:hypothetical protein
MNRDTIQAALGEAIQTTLEGMCFLEAEPSDTKSAIGADWVQLHVAATSPLDCVFTLAADTETVAALRDALFSDNCAVEVGDFDVVAEVLNVAAGRFLSALDGAVPVAMGLPRNGRAALPQSEGIELAYRVDSGALVVNLSGALFG